MTKRRTVLKSIASAIGCLGISGCITDLGEEATSTPTENIDTSTASSTVTKTETPTSTATGTPTSTERTPPTAAELPDLRLANHTETVRTLTLEVAPKSNDSVTNSWTLQANSNVKVDTYKSLDSAAKITASVEGYETVAYDWPGDEPGQTLSVTIKDNIIGIETFMA